MKYKLEVRGWSNDSMAFSLSDEQVKSIESMMEGDGVKPGNYVDYLENIRYHLEDTMDIWEPDLFQKIFPSDNDALYFIVTDEHDNVVVEFGVDECGDLLENVGDVYEMYKDSGLTTDPKYCEASNTMLVIEELKGGIYDMCFESEEIPKPSDFSIMGEINRIPSWWH